MKKRMLLGAIFILSVLCLISCKMQTKEERYKAAVEKFEADEFEEAKEMFLKLDGYEDSEEYVKKTDYRMAIETYKAGEFEDAKEMFLDLEGYKKSDRYVTKAEIMSKIQGTYVDWNGGTAFTIDKFRVLNWNEDTTIELTDPSNKIMFKCPEFGKSAYSLSLKGSKVTLTTKTPHMESVYEKVQ